MLAMIGRFFGFSKPEPPPHTRSNVHRLDSFCSKSAAFHVRQSDNDAAPSTAAPAASAPLIASDNQVAGWREMRRAAGWQALESKPDGRQLLPSSDGGEAGQLDRLRYACARLIADGSEVAEAPLAAPVLGPAPHDCAIQKSLGAAHLESSAEITWDGPTDATAATLPRNTESPPILADRRATRRYSASQVNGQFTILVDLCKTMLRDISTTGVSLVLGAHDRLRTFLQLSIMSKRYGITGPIQARVVRLIPLADGRLLTCCVFDKPLDHEWLKALISQRVTPVRTECMRKLVTAAVMPTEQSAAMDEQAATPPSEGSSSDVSLTPPTPLLMEDRGVEEGTQCAPTIAVRALPSPSRLVQQVIPKGAQMQSCDRSALPA